MTISGSVLVSGASRGLGAHICRRLAADGWPVAVNYRSDASGAARVVADIEAAGGRAAAFHADVTDEHEVASLAAAVERTLAPVRVVVANATGPQPEVRAEDTTWQDHLDQLTFFVKSPTLLQATLPHMRRLGGRPLHHGRTPDRQRRLHHRLIVKPSIVGPVGGRPREIGPFGGERPGRCRAGEFPTSSDTAI